MSASCIFGKALDSGHKFKRDQWGEDELLKTRTFPGTAGCPCDRKKITESYFMSVTYKFREN